MILLYKEADAYASAFYFSELLSTLYSEELVF